MVNGNERLNDLVDIVTEFEPRKKSLTSLCFLRTSIHWMELTLLCLNYQNQFMRSVPDMMLTISSKITSFTSFEQIWIPFTQGCFVPSLVEISPVVLEKKMKMCKVYRQTDRQTTDNRWSEKLTWAFSSGELKSMSDAAVGNQVKVVCSQVCGNIRKTSKSYAKISLDGRGRSWQSNRKVIKHKATVPWPPVVVSSTLNFILGV